MPYHQDHEPGHDHIKNTHSTLSFDEKLIKRLEHWIKHNNDHAKSYREWADKARAHEMENTGRLLEDVTEMTRLITAKFEEALRDVKNG